MIFIKKTVLVFLSVACLCLVLMSSKTIKHADAATPSIKVAGDSAVLENNYLKCNLSFSNGPLITELVNKFVKSNIIDGQSRVFKVFHGSKPIANESFRLADVSVKNLQDKTGEAKVLITKWQSIEAPLTLVLSIKLDSSPDMKWNVDVTNTGSTEEIYAVACPLLEHIRIGDQVSDDEFFYPLSSGMCGSLDYELRAYYGVTLMMQVMDVFDPATGGGIYTMAKDNTGTPKMLIVRRGSQTGTKPPNYTSYADTDGEYFDAAAGSGMIIRHLEYQLKANESASLPETVVGVHKGDWHYPLSQYSKWVHSWYKKDLPTPKWYMDTYIFLGAHPFGHQYMLSKKSDPNGFWDADKREYTYAKQMGTAEENTVMEFAGWNDYQTKRPNMTLNEVVQEYNGDVISAFRIGDYDYNIERGGLEPFKEEIRKIHENKGRFMLYTYPAAIAADSKIGQAHGKEWAAMNVPGKYNYDYTLEGKGWNMCLYSPGFREYFSKLMAEKVKETGSDGYRQDVFSFMYPCYNPAHAHYNGTVRSAMPAAEFRKLLKATQSEVRAANPEAVTTTEHAGTEYLTQNTDGYLIQNPIWVQDDFFKPFKVLDKYGIVFTRFYLPESKAFIHGIDSNEDSAKMELFNTAAIAYPYPPMAFTYDSLRENGDALNSGLTPEPLIETLINGVKCNYFPGNVKSIWTIYNKSGKNLSKESLVEVPYRKGVRYVEVLKDTPVKAVRVGKNVRLSCPVADKDVLVIVQMPIVAKVAVAGGKANISAPAGCTLQVAYGEEAPGKREVVKLQNGKASVDVATDKKTIIKIIDGYYLKDEIILSVK